MNISRPTMIIILKQNTKGLTHMNKKHMWKIIEEKGLNDKAFELEKNHKRKRIRRSVVVVDLETNKKCFSKERERERESLLAQTLNNFMQK